MLGQIESLEGDTKHKERDFVTNIFLKILFQHENLLQIIDLSNILDLMYQLHKY